MKATTSNRVHVKNDRVAGKGKETVRREEVSKDESRSSLEKKRRVMWILVGLEKTINVVPCSPEPEKEKYCMKFVTRKKM